MGLKYRSSHVQAAVRRTQVGEDLLDEKLGRPIGVGGPPHREVLPEGHPAGIPIDGSRGGEHKILHAVLPHHIEQDQGVDQIVGVVLKRLADALAHGLEAGEVDDGIDVVLGEHAVERFAVEDAGLVERQSIIADAGDGPHAVERNLARVAQVVQHDHAVSPVQQLDARVAADEPGTSCDQHAGIRGSLSKASVRHGILAFVSGGRRAAHKLFSCGYCTGDGVLPGDFVESNMSGRQGEARG